MERNYCGIWLYKYPNLRQADRVDSVYHSYAQALVLWRDVIIG